MTAEFRTFVCEDCGHSEEKFQEVDFAPWDMFKCPECDGWMK